MLDDITPAALYHDPRTGERITEDEYKRRYGLAGFLPVRAVPTGVAADAPGLPPFGARCPDCGCAVTTEGELCALDQQKRDAKVVPVFARTLATQPEPAYVRAAREAEQKNTVVGTDADAYPAGTVLGGGSTGDGA